MVPFFVINIEIIPSVAYFSKVKKNIFILTTPRFLCRVRFSRSSFFTRVGRLHRLEYGYLAFTFALMDWYVEILSYTVYSGVVIN